MKKEKWYQRTSDTVDHIVYLNKKAKELEQLVDGSKTMIIRGAAGKKVPLGRVFADDTLYFVQNDGSCMILATAHVKSVFLSEKMTEEESIKLVDDNMGQLKLSKEQVARWAGKKFLCLIEVDQVKEITLFQYNRTSTMDDWIIVEDINQVRI